MSMANGSQGERAKEELSPSVGGSILRKILLLKLGDIDKGTVQKKFWSMKKTIIQLIKSYLQQGHCLGVLSFLLMVSALRAEAAQCHCGENLSREGRGSGRKGKMGRTFCQPQCGTGRVGECTRRSLRGGGEAGALSVLWV